MKRVFMLAGILVAATLGIIPGSGLAHTAVHFGIQIGAPPQLAVVPGTPVYYAPPLLYNYFLYGERYYLFHNGAWFFAPTYNGPWTVTAVHYVPRPILRVPVAYYPAPPHWRRHGPPPWAHAWGHGKKWRGRHHD